MPAHGGLSGSATAREAGPLCAALSLSAGDEQRKLRAKKRSPEGEGDWPVEPETGQRRGKPIGQPAGA